MLFRVVKLLLVVCLFIPRFGLADHADRRTYTIGVVPQFEQRKLFRIWQPIIKELESRTNLAFHLVGSPKIPAFEKKYLAGEYDFAYMNPYHFLRARESQGYVPLIRDGSRELKGVLVVRKDSPIQSVKELQGKILAFPSPNALGASLLMRAELSQILGISFYPRYVQTHSSVYLNVALNQAEAGGGVMSTLKAQPENVQNKLRVIHQTRGIAPHPLVAHPRVRAEDQVQVQQALLAMAETESGRELLSQIPIRQAVSAKVEDYLALESWGLDAFFIKD